MRKVIVMLGLVCYTLVMTLSVSGCNTTEGAGEDIQDAGRAIEDAAD